MSPSFGDASKALRRNSANEPQYGQGSIHVTTAVLDVEGMSCGHCESSIRTTLEGLDGVAVVQADHAVGEVKVVYDGGIITRDSIEGSLEELGYTTN